ncbi:MAG: hypothetical protein NT029_14430 [Armatimonadetes bacterium]|nr:hypothetical protein [Armatimonadota bacterium]
MRLPNSERAFVDRAKVVAYLLNPDHPDGGTKAAFFAAFGFRRQRWRALAEALVEHGTTNEVVRVVESPFGVRFMVAGPIQSPDGRHPGVVTVWIVEAAGPSPGGASAPRLVTAYPA